MTVRGAGLGYRGVLRDDILSNISEIDFLEIISDQFLFVPEDRRDALAQLTDAFPLVCHSVGLSLGSVDLPDEQYVDRLGELINAVSPAWFSDHVAISRNQGADFEQLASLWRTEESLDILKRNIREVKKKVQAPFIVENITHYYSFDAHEMPEAEFIRRAAVETDSGILLDLNNAYVNSINLKQDPITFIDGLPLERVMQIHLAGGTKHGDIIVDTHSQAVSPPVWKLLEYVLKRTSKVAVLLEWDADFPQFEVLLSHLERARSMLRSAGHI